MRRRTASAQVTRIEVLSREPMAAGQAVGAAGPYEIVRGRVHGEVDAADRRNAIIQDLPLAPRNARGRAEYVATFALAKPVDLARASGVLIYSVVNRGNGSPQASADGHVWLVSGWQGDLPAGRRQADDRRARRAQRRRHADHRPDDRALRERGARHDDAADPPRDDRQPAAGLSAGRPRAAATRA